MVVEVGFRRVFLRRELRPLAYRPDTELARRRAESWVDPPFLVFFGNGRPDRTYEAYSPGTGYGRVRLLTLEEFEKVNRSGVFTLQDILVVDQAPRDIDGVIGGLITAEPQGELSHTAIRLARQGTPNGYIAGAREALARHEGKLVRLELCESGHVVDGDVTLEEAEAFWSANRPELPGLPGTDAEYRQLDDLLEIDLAAGGAPPEARFGGKASNLARLQRILTGDLIEYREPGFAIPVAHYLEFLRRNSLVVEGRRLTYEEYLSELVAAADFQSDSRTRVERLDDFLASEFAFVPPRTSRTLSSSTAPVSTSRHRSAPPTRWTSGTSRALTAIRRETRAHPQEGLGQPVDVSGPRGAFLLPGAPGERPRRARPGVPPGPRESLSTALVPGPERDPGGGGLRVVSDLSVLVGQQRDHRIIAAGDLNVLFGHGEDGLRALSRARSQPERVARLLEGFSRDRNVMVRSNAAWALRTRGSR